MQTGVEGGCRACIGLLPDDVQGPVRVDLAMFGGVWRGGWGGLGGWRVVLRTMVLRSLWRGGWGLLGIRGTASIWASGDPRMGTSIEKRARVVRVTGMSVWKVAREGSYDGCSLPLISVG